jgi:uncharacterized protein YjbJ (UPF0337 family)
MENPTGKIQKSTGKIQNITGFMQNIIGKIQKSIGTGKNIFGGVLTNAIPYKFDHTAQ